MNQYLVPSDIPAQTAATANAWFPDEDSACIALGAVGDSYFAVVRRCGDVTLWDTRTRRPVRIVSIDYAPLTGAIVTADGIVVVWCWDSIAYCFDGHNLELLHALDVVAGSPPPREEHTSDESEDEFDDEFEEDEDEDEEEDEDSAIVEILPLADGSILVSHRLSWLERFNPRTGKHLQSIPDVEEAERSFVSWSTGRSVSGQPAWIETHDWRNLRVWYLNERLPRYEFSITTGNLIECFPLDATHIAVRRRGGAIQCWSMPDKRLVSEMRLKATSMFHVPRSSMPAGLVMAGNGNEHILVNPLTELEAATAVTLPPFSHLLPLHNGDLLCCARSEMLVLNSANLSIVRRWPSTALHAHLSLELSDGVVVVFGEQGGLSWQDTRRGFQIGG